MRFPWLMHLLPDAASALASLRLAPGLEVAEASGQLWLRGPAPDEAVARQLSALPAVERFERLDNDQIRRVDHRIPAGPSPALSWQPLAAWIRVTLGVAALPSMELRPVELRPVSSVSELEPTLLLTTLDAWFAYAAAAPRVRLQRLRFAASADRRVLIEGQPLPPVSGQRFVVHGRIGVPAGFALPVHPELLARRFSVPDGALALWHADGTITRLLAEQFIPATRAAARATAEGMGPVDSGTVP